MKISYQIFRFVLKFEKKVNVDIYPSFLLRSILGKELKTLGCIFMDRSTCEDCPINDRCAYSYIFESIISKDNDIIKGRNRIPHPFIIKSDIDNFKLYDSFDFDIVLLGSAIDYFPYIYQSFIFGGEKGIGKDRIKYTVEKILHNGENLLESSKMVKLPKIKSFWKNESGMTAALERKITIKFISPFRHQKNNIIQKDVSYSAVLTDCLRSILLLSSFYGDEKEFTEEKFDFNKFEESKIVSKKLVWKDYSRYSARQERKMSLGGLIGEMTIAGLFSPLELSLLYGGEIFSIGKNTGFGLGNIRLIIE